MFNPIQNVLDQQPFLILDGALATELENRGADLNDDLWSAKILLEQPELIYQVHMDYLKAGADIITTATYQATFEGLKKRGISNEQAITIFRQSLNLAQQAVVNFWSDIQNRHQRIKPLIAASVGPYGAMLADGSEYHGNYGRTEQELIDFHRPRIETLVESGATLLALETIPSKGEGAALIKLLEEFPKIAAYLSFSCCDDSHVCHGERFANCVKMVNSSEQIVAVGVNCTPPNYVASLIEAAKAITTKPILVYPNSGEQWDAAQHCWLETDDNPPISELALDWAQKGAQIIGGCCRTKPLDIAKIRQNLIKV